MNGVQTSVELQDIAIRLACTAIAAALLGINRGAHGRPAGLRTMLLVGLAACIAMLQANLLLGSHVELGKDSILRMDVLRLPLGILSGIGFIGAGAILRRGELVQGLTTAATLWMVTVLGLCFGGGQLALGAAGTALTLFVIWGLQRAETYIERQRRGILTLSFGRAENRDAARARIAAAGVRVASEGLRESGLDQRYTIVLDLRWMADNPDDNTAPPVVRDFTGNPDVVELTWEPRGLELN